MAGNIGLTDIQQVEYDEFKKRKNGEGKPLTPKMEETFASYQNKIDKPELPQGAKTYCKKWLKEYLYKRRTDIQSKYITKGNETEESGFTLMCLELKLGMVYKNEQYRENDSMTGTWDLKVPDEVLDNKSCWSLDIFPMFEIVNPKPEYDWQMDVYMELAEVSKARLCYTLNDTPEILIQKELRWVDAPEDRIRVINNMVFTRPYFEAMRNKYAPESDLDFVEIPQNKRIKTFSYIKDPVRIYRIRERVKMCNVYINSLI